MRQRLRDGRLGTLIAMVAQHTTSTGQFIAPDNWRADAAGGAGRRADRRRRACARPHDRVRRPRARRACTTARYVPGPSDDTTTVMLRFESGATGTIFCSVATATNFSFTLYGSKGLAEISRPEPAGVPLRAGPRSIRRPARWPRRRTRSASMPDFDMLNAELTEFARCDPRAAALSGGDRRGAARHVGVRRHRPLGGKPERSKPSRN